MDETPTDTTIPLPSWELTGPADAPVVAVLGGISATRHVTATGFDCEPGWWQAVVGSGRPIDTDHLRVLGIDWVTPASRAVTTADQADALLATIDHLGIARLDSIVGSSYGGMVALAFAERYPERVERVAVIAAAHRSHPMATAHRIIQRRIIELAAAAGKPQYGVALARALAITGYRTDIEFEERFASAPIQLSGRTGYAVEEYLDHNGNAFAARWERERYLALSESLDSHNVDPGNIKVPLALLGITTDTIVPPWQLRELARLAGGDCSLEFIESRYGHDGFLKEDVAVGAFITRWRSARREVCRAA